MDRGLVSTRDETEEPDIADRGFGREKRFPLRQDQLRPGTRGTDPLPRRRYRCKATPRSGPERGCSPLEFGTLLPRVRLRFPEGV